MPFKHCPACRHLSFCSCSSVIWICPCCGQELSQSPTLNDPRQNTDSEQLTPEPVPYLVLVGGSNPHNFPHF